MSLTTDKNILDSNCDNICMVCYEPLNEDIGFETTKCGHKYCSGCYDAHMKIDNKCAMCRTVLKEKSPGSIPSIVPGSLPIIALDEYDNLGFDLDPLGVFDDLDRTPVVYTRPLTTYQLPIIVHTRPSTITVTTQQVSFEVGIGQLHDYKPCGSCNYSVIHG
jgi:hypothetical protein